jgi:hypothetical protein
MTEEPLTLWSDSNPRAYVVTLSGRSGCVLKTFFCSSTFLGRCTTRLLEHFSQLWDIHA